MVYYATAVGSTPATNDPNKWIANQWQKFNPGLYDSANRTTDNYSNIAPAYVMAAGGPGTYTGAPWEVHFTCSRAQLNQGQYVVLSVGLAANEASLTVTLNGHQDVWHFGGTASDAMVRSGVAGEYEFLAFQFPTSDLNAAGADNVFTFGVSQTDGVMYDALRMEITNTSASPDDDRLERLRLYHRTKYPNQRERRGQPDGIATVGRSRRFQPRRQGDLRRRAGDALGASGPENVPGC